MTFAQTVTDNGKTYIELTLAQAFRDRVTALEASQAAQDAAIASLQAADTTFNTRLGTAETNITNLQQADTNFTTQINGLLATDVAQGSRLTSLETSQVAQDTAISNLQVADTAFNTRLGTTETNVTNLQTSDGAQTTRLLTLETSQAIQDTAITGLQTADTAFNTRLGTTETNVTNLQTSDASQSIRLNNLDTLVATKVNQAAIDSSITAYDQAVKIIRPFTVTNTVQQGSIYVHTLDCATGLGTTDFVMAEARFTADTPLRRLETPPQYITPDTCRIMVEGTDATIPVGAVEGFFERFYRAQ